MRKKEETITEHITFERLIDSIRRIHTRLASQASRAVNVSLTMRNWLIGLYIDEFELRGADRAKYGENLLLELAGRLTGLKISNCNRRQLYRYLRFCRLYPAIVGTLSPQLRPLLPGQISAEAKAGALSPQLQIPAETLIQRLSYSHIELIADLEDPLKRVFYEIECLHGNWSVRELKRQIGSLYYERSGLSKNKKKLSEMVRQTAQTVDPTMTIRDPSVGILLCTGKNQTLVEYALAGMDNRLFVSKYRLELPKKEEMKQFIEQQIKESEV